jgi:hypothetical protein
MSFSSSSPNKRLDKSFFSIRIKPQTKGNAMFIFWVRFTRYGENEIFQCEAENEEHAREQALNAWPNMKIKVIEKKT